MNVIKSKYQVENKKIVIFGAGKIGRSFIGQLFGSSGYKIIFIDVDQDIIKGLNEKGNYRVIIKGEPITEIIVTNVQAIYAFDKQKVVEAISTAGILAVSVGKNALDKVIPVIAEGLKIRYNMTPKTPLDIIIAENMREAGNFIKTKLTGYLPLDYPLSKLVGFVETSIGKMVPIMTFADLEKDPLMVFAEPYNTLIVDGKGFKSPIPEVIGLAAKENIKAWVDRKAFIHNLGHATAAYFGLFKHPNATYIYEIIEDKEVLRFTRETMQQAAALLQVMYPRDFSLNDLEAHIDDLLFRFRNKALKDTIFRVGHDLVRKLSSEDRFIGAIHLAIKVKMPYDKILKACSYGFSFNPKDEAGNYFPPDKVFIESLATGFESSMKNILGLNPISDYSIINELKQMYENSSPNL